MIKMDARCPACGHIFDDAAAVGGEEVRRPEVGNVSICIACAEIGFYVLNPDGETLGVRVPTDAEKVELSQDATLMEVQWNVRMVAAGLYS